MFIKFLFRRERFQAMNPYFFIAIVFFNVLQTHISPQYLEYQFFSESLHHFSIFCSFSTDIVVQRAYKFYFLIYF